MPRLALCYSARQDAFVSGLAERLSRNLDIGILPIAAGPAAPIAEAWEQGQAVEALLLLLDAESSPGPVRREDWAGLLEHAGGAQPVAVLRMEPCLYPKLLERRGFLAPNNALEAERWVERWLTELLPAREAGLTAAAGATGAVVPGVWWTQLVDQPGLCVAAAEDAAAAQTFAGAAGGHFQEVFWIGCERRAEASIAAEMEDRSRGAVRQLFILVHASGPGAWVPHGSRHSCLVLAGEPAVTDADDPMATWVGACRASGFPAEMMELMLPGRSITEWAHLAVLLDRSQRWYRAPRRFAPSPETRARHLAVLEESFRNWRLHVPLCRALTGEADAAVREGLAADNAAGTRELGRQLALLLIGEKRHAEAVDLLGLLIAKATAAGDADCVRLARHELSWLVDSETGAPMPEVDPGGQLAFEFRD